MKPLLSRFDKRGFLLEKSIKIKTYTKYDWHSVNNQRRYINKAIERQNKNEDMDLIYRLKSLKNDFGTNQDFKKISNKS